MSKRFYSMSVFACLALLSGCAQEKKPPSDLSFDQNNGNSREGVADCSQTFSKSGLCLSMNWVKKPTSTEFGAFTFKTYRLNVLDQTPVEVDLAGTPDVILWMPSMGHGSSPVNVERIDTGTYRANHVFFVMPGVWQIKWQVKQGSVVEDEAVVDFTI